MNLFQPKNLKDQIFINNLKDLNADLQIVVAFRMLPKIVWDLPPLGTFNLHASLLPNYKVLPIVAIINGETETGVTTFIDDKPGRNNNAIKVKFYLLIMQELHMIN